MESDKPPGAAAPAAPPELLAPAGDAAALDAALQAGADAVYLGLTVLNARRRAANFAPHELAGAVRRAHAAGARLYLTLNTDLAEDELETAARAVLLARDAGCDGLLVRDPALLALREAIQGPPLHFSTQTCMTNSADVAAAARLGARRAVLARELSLEEIAAASAAADIETEVFVQGALCFCVSGRCLLSSWAGGRSGNRGLCASPCRVPWSADGGPEQRLLSMSDLAALDHVARLRQVGAAALKIEGRMKHAPWVARAVRVYRQALDGRPTEHLRDEVRQLAHYSGRRVTVGFLEAQRMGLSGDEGGRTAGRPATDEPPGAAGVGQASGYRFSILLDERGVQCRWELGNDAETWTIPNTVIRRPRKAVTVGQFFQRLEQAPLAGCRLAAAETNAPEHQMPPRVVNNLTARITKCIHRARRRRARIAKAPLPPAVSDLLAAPSGGSPNRMQLGHPPNWVRLPAAAAAAFLRQHRVEGAVVEDASPETLAPLRRIARRTTLVAALPPVFFEDRLPAVRELAAWCAKTKTAVEANSWGGWLLARRAGAVLETGPGLPVLNSLAARMLRRLGARCVTLSLEADRRQLERLTSRCPIACSLIVFGRPPLMISRVKPPPEWVDVELSDRRDLRLRSRREHGLWVLRPEAPFDLRRERNERIRVRRLVVDLTASPDPAGEWRRPAAPNQASTFNYHRTLA